MDIGELMHGPKLYMAHLIGALAEWKKAGNAAGSSPHAAENLSRYHVEDKAKDGGNKSAPVLDWGPDP